MENNIEKAEKLEVKSLRLSQSVDAKIKELAGEHGNVNGLIEYLLTLNEKENNVIKYTDYKANIESFNVLLSKLDSSFMGIIETSSNASEFARAEVAKELDANKEVIADLLEVKKQNAAVIDKLNFLVSEERSEKEKYERESERLLDINEKNTDIISSKKNEILMLSSELNKYKKFADENATLISSISKLEEDNKILKNTLAEYDLKVKSLNNESSVDKSKIEDLKIQLTELKSEIKLNKDYSKEVETAYKAELKELSKAHKDELERVNNSYESKLDREIDSITRSANKEIDLIKRDAVITEHKLLSDISILQEKYKMMTEKLNKYKNEIARYELENKKDDKVK